jgi:hypothetical protein
MVAAPGEKVCTLSVRDSIVAERGFSQVWRAWLTSCAPEVAGLRALCVW